MATLSVHAHRVPRMRGDPQPPIIYHEHMVTVDPRDRVAHLLDQYGGHAHLDKGIGASVVILTHAEHSALMREVVR